jgi:aryl-alcohol dehydrogenase-like predicted oxidoreductase
VVNTVGNSYRMGHPLEIVGRLVPIPGTRAANHLEECAAAAQIDLTDAQLAAIENALPVGFAAGERYSDQQWVGIQKY